MKSKIKLLPYGMVWLTKLLSSKIFLSTFVVLILFSSRSLYAEDLMFFYNSAREFDAQFSKAKYDKAASREIIKQAYSRLFPTLTLNAEHTNTKDDIKSSDNTVYGSGVAHYPSDSYTLALVQPIFNFSYIMGVIKAKEEIRRSDVEYVNARQEIIIRVAENYFNTLSAKDNYEFYKSELAAVEQHYNLAKVQLDNGQIPVTDMLDARARSATVFADMIKSENELDDAREALYVVSGQKDIKLSGIQTNASLAALEPADYDSWMQIALEKNLEIIIEKHEVEIAKREIKRLKADHFPVLNLELRDEWSDVDGSLFGGGSEVETQEIAFQLSFPIFKGGFVSSQVREALQLHKAAKEELRNKTLLVKRKTRSTYLGVKSAIIRANAYEKSVEAQKLTLEAKQQGFKSGLFTSLDVLDAERDLYEAKRDYTKARYDYITNILNLKFSVGTLTEEDIAKVNTWLD